MCCDHCCECDRPHADEDYREVTMAVIEHELEQLVRDCVENFDLAAYGVEVTACPAGNLDARLGTWRRRLIDDIMSDILGVVIRESR